MSAVHVIYLGNVEAGALCRSEVRSILQRTKWMADSVGVEFSSSEHKGWIDSHFDFKLVGDRTLVHTVRDWVTAQLERIV